MTVRSNSPSAMPRGRFGALGCALFAGVAFATASSPAAAQQKYLFPGKPAHLDKGSYWAVLEFDEGGPVENILDLNIIRRVDGNWSGCDGDCGTLENDIMWRVPLYAPADGFVAGCWRNFPDNPNPPNKRADVIGVDNDTPKKIFRGGNVVVIITDDNKIVSLAHLAKGSIPASLCPPNAGNQTFPANVNKDGSDWYTAGYIPPGSRPRVNKGQFVGRAGNSGNSSGVHLHTQVNTINGTKGGREKWGPNIPIPWERVYTQSHNPNAAPIQNNWSAANTTITSSDDGPTLFLPAGKYAEDIVWQKDNGQIQYWAMEAGVRAAGFNIDQPVGAQWVPVGVGNIDGKAQNDIIFRAGNGQFHYWSIQNGKRVSAGNIATPVGAGWKFGGVGDVDGDGTDDLVFAKQGQVHYWKMKNGKRIGAANISAPVSAGWRMGGIGDVDGDGTEDIVWRHANGQVHYWKMKNGKRVGAANVEEPVGSNWFMRDIGDVDQDGTDDIVWQRDDGQVHYWKMKGGKRVFAAHIHSPVSNQWKLFGVGDVGTRP